MIYTARVFLRSLELLTFPSFFLVEPHALIKNHEDAKTLEQFHWTGVPTLRIVEVFQWNALNSVVTSVLN